MSKECSKCGNRVKYLVLVLDNTTCEFIVVCVDCLNDFALYGEFL